MYKIYDYVNGYLWETTTREQAYNRVIDLLENYEYSGIPTLLEEEKENQKFIIKRKWLWKNDFIEKNTKCFYIIGTKNIK